MISVSMTMAMALAMEAIIAVLGLQSLWYIGLLLRSSTMAYFFIHYATYSEKKQNKVQFKS